MTTPTPLPTHSAHYLAKLAQALSSLPDVERRSIIDETKAHFLDSFMAGGEDALERTIQAFGQPETYAANFIETAQIRAAVSSGSIAGMMKHTIFLAFTSLWYFIAALLAFCAYITALGFALISILKLFTPGEIGFWMWSDREQGFGLIFGSLSGSSPASPEILGYWVIPISAALCFLTFKLGNWLVRKTLLRRLGTN